MSGAFFIGFSSVFTHKSPLKRATLRPPFLFLTYIFPYGRAQLFAFVGQRFFQHFRWDFAEPGVQFVTQFIHAHFLR
ncbi:hypothetical protein RAVI111496_21785 [Rahnella victoriana]